MLQVWKRAILKIFGLSEILNAGKFDKIRVVELPFHDEPISYYGTAYMEWEFKSLLYLEFHPLLTSHHPNPQSPSGIFFSC
jgi:hypothetical protein